MLFMFRKAVTLLFRFPAVSYAGYYLIPPRVVPWQTIMQSRRAKERIYNEALGRLHASCQSISTLRYPQTQYEQQLRAIPIHLAM